jgi:hypothetical protein
LADSTAGLLSILRRNNEKLDLDVRLAGDQISQAKQTGIDDGSVFDLEGTLDGVRLEPKHIDVFDDFGCVGVKAQVGQSLEADIGEFLAFVALTLIVFGDPRIATKLVAESVAPSIVDKRLGIQSLPV